jgi:hypothetical protein
MAAAAWKISVQDGLRAYFLQPDGSSRLGIDWTVQLDDGRDKKQVVVRAYLENADSIKTGEESRLVASFVQSLLDSGWTPRDWTGRPGELTTVLLGPS